MTVIVPGYSLPQLLNIEEKVKFLADGSMNIQ